MNLQNLPLDSLNLELLNHLVDNKASESVAMEFKRDTYGNSDSDRKELIKDVSALANTRGGIIFIGIDEIEGCADKIVAFEGDSDSEVLRLNAILQSSIEPTVAGLEIKAINANGIGNVIVIKVPKSWAAPHRTDFKGIKRFYRRNSSGVYEPDVTELKKMFNASLEQEKQFKLLRSEHVDSVRSDETPFVMPNLSSGSMLLQLIPLQSIEQATFLDLGKYDLRTSLRPFGGSGWDSRYNIDGYITFRRHYHAYTQLYRNGIIEAVISSISREAGENTNRKIIAGSTISEYLLAGVASYFEVLKELDVQTPVRVHVSLLDVKNCRFATYHDRWGMDEDEVPYIGKTDVFLPPVDIMEFGDKFETYEALRPILDALWNADNTERCDYYDEAGRWIGHDNVRNLGRKLLQR